MGFDVKIRGLRWDYHGNKIGNIMEINSMSWDIGICVYIYTHSIYNYICINPTTMVICTIITGTAPSRGS